MNCARTFASAMAGICIVAGVAHAEGGFVNLLDNSMQERAALTRFRGHAPMSRTGKLTLGAALQTVINGTGLQFHVDWEALRGAGLTEDSEVTLPAKVMSYDEYLRAVGVDAGVEFFASFDGATGGFSLSTHAAGPPATTVFAETNLPHHEVRETPARSSHIAHVSLDTPQDAAVKRRIDATAMSIHFDQTAMEKAINTIRDSCGCNFYVNWTALQAAGIDKNSPVSANMKDVPARKALTTLLNQVGGGAAQLGFTVADGVVEISTKDDLNSVKYQTVRIFDINGFLAERARGNRSADDRVKEIVDTLKTVVAPESWRDAGGMIGSIREEDGLLIVNQTMENQAAVADLLRQLGSRRGVRTENMVVK